MLLRTDQHKIYYIELDAIDNSANWNTKYIAKNSLKDWVMPVLFNTSPSNHNYNGAYYKYYNTRDMPKRSYGIYLGDNTSIKAIINSKLSKANLGTIKKVYFDPYCKYPRFKLSAMTNIKRCLDPSKADSVIISDYKFRDYVSSPFVGKRRDEVLILYSAQEESYYFLDYTPEAFYDQSKFIKFQNELAKYANPIATDLDYWASGLIACQALPADCKEFYRGKVMLINSDEELNYFDNLINNYMLITYDTELDKFVSNGMPKPTQEDLSTLNNMLSSSDNSVVGMGIKLLSSYDITTSICTIGILIAKNWNTMRDSTVIKSVGFEQVLTTLGLLKTDLDQKSYNTIINTLYQNSQDPVDRENARTVLIESITRDMQKYWDRVYKNPLLNLDLYLKMKIE